MDYHPRDAKCLVLRAPAMCFHTLSSENCFDLGHGCIWHHDMGIAMGRPMNAMAWNVEMEALKGVSE